MVRSASTSIVVSLLAVALVGCSQIRPVDGSDVWDATGQAVREKWRPVGLARRAAIDRAAAQARHALWMVLMEKTIAWPDASKGAGYVAQLAVMDDAFASRLRGLVAALEPQVVSESPDGLTTVRLAVSVGRVAHLVAAHGALLRPASSVPTRVGRIPAVAGE